MLDFDLARLQYEILGVPLETLAKRLEVPEYLLKAEAEKQCWTPLWDENDQEPVVIEDGDDGFSIKADEFTDRTRKKLIAFALAKEILLSQKYLELESNIITKANDILETISGDGNSVSAIKALASLYKDMSKNVLSTGYNSAAVSIGTDESGLPTVIVRDLTGQSQGLKK